MFVCGTDACTAMMSARLLPSAGLGRRQNAQDPSGAAVWWRGEAARGQRVSDAERGLVVGVRKARLAVSRAHHLSAVSCTAASCPAVS